MMKVAMVKVAAAVGVVLLLGIVGGIMVSNSSATKPVEIVETAPAGAPSPGPVSVADPADWRTAFNNAYALRPNENLKFIPPPPLPERQKYLHEVENNDTPMPFIQWRWINGTLKRQVMRSAGPDGVNLSAVLADCANLDGHHTSLVGVPPIIANGDWIVRDGATTQAILADLHTILIEQLKTDLRFEKDEVTKDALVVTGNYHLQRMPEATFGDLQIFSDILDHPKAGDSIAGGGTTNPADFWTLLGGYLGVPLVDETQNEPEKINWLFSRSIAHGDQEPRRQQILDNITKQTGVVFKQEKRTFTSWKVTPAAAKGTPLKSTTKNVPSASTSPTSSPSNSSAMPAPPKKAKQTQSAATQPGEERD